MKRRTHILAAMLEAAVVLAAIYFEPSHCVRGKLAGEAFFDGKPTSWWRRELEQWDVSEIWIDIGGGHKEPRIEWCLYRRERTWFDKMKDGHWQFWKAGQPRRFNLVNIHLDTEGPLIVRGQPEAAPVLRQLLDDPSPKVRRLARIGLKMAPE